MRPRSETLRRASATALSLVCAALFGVARAQDAAAVADDGTLDSAQTPAMR